MSPRAKKAQLSESAIFVASNGPWPCLQFSPRPSCSRWTQLWCVIIAAPKSEMAQLIFPLLQVADIQPHIINSVGEFEKFPWLGSAFVLPAATLQLPWAKAYSLFDIKWLYFANVTLFEIGSAISGASPTMNSLIIGRTIAGIGGCGMYLGGLTFLSVATTPRERPIYVSLVTPVWGLGTVLGPIVSLHIVPHVLSVLTTGRLVAPLPRARSDGDGGFISTSSSTSQLPPQCFSLCPLSTLHPA